MGNKLENERTKRKHMENELTKLKTQIEQKEKGLSKIKDDLSKIKNQSMTTEERLNELNSIYNVLKFNYKKYYLFVKILNYYYLFCRSKKKLMQKNSYLKKIKCLVLRIA